MSIIIFFIILGLLVLVHELGHFLAAKRAGVKVEEFGFGYPPRALVLGSRFGTLFSLNWIPFGGFVKIFGENNEVDETGVSGRSFAQIPRPWQAVILAAGVFFNLLFAWLLFTTAFLIGVPSSTENDFGGVVKNPVLTIVQVLPASPAAAAQLKTGDQIIRAGNSTSLTPEGFAEIMRTTDRAVVLELKHGREMRSVSILPTANVLEGKKAIGVQLDMVGLLTLPPHSALYQGLRTTYSLTSVTLKGIGNLLSEAVRGRPDISAVTGPVGIVGLVGDASRLGFSYLLTFTALISINLAVVNLIPFPALDGGRLLIVFLEGLLRRPLNTKLVQSLNTIGFALLITLMVFITYRDILKLF